MSVSLIMQKLSVPNKMSHRKSVADLTEAEVASKVVFVRCDFNVPQVSVRFR